MKEFMGFHRPDGSVGIRNNVVILSIMGLANPIVRRLSQCIRGTIPIFTPNGRGQVGEDRAQLERTLLGLGQNPNVASILIVSYEEISAQLYAEALRKTGKPVEVLCIIENQGVINATEKGMRILLDMLIEASTISRKPAPLSALTVALECGGSDPSSGKISNPALGAVADMIVNAGGTIIFSETVELIGTQQILAKRAVDPQIGKKIISTIEQVFVQAEARGADVKAVNPVPENIHAGLQTLEEKALGALMKTGTSPIQDVLKYAEKPQQSGLYFMDTPFFSTESMAGMIAAGAQLTLFSTGVGNNIATPISPTLKVTGNPHTNTLMGEHIDVDVSETVCPGANLAQRASVVFTEMLAVCNGKLTKSEVLDETDLAISRLGPSV